MVQTDLRDRILHGSDVPVPVTASLLWALGIVSWREWRETARVANPLERDVQIKRAMGFPATSQTTLAGLLRPVGP
jgi:hypothetical protein